MSESDYASEERIRGAANELLAALKSIVPRFHACCLSGGSDPEYCDLVIKPYLEVIAKAEGKS